MKGGMYDKEECMKGGMYERRNVQWSHVRQETFGSKRKFRIESNVDVHAKLASEFIEHFSMSIPIHSRLYYIPYSMYVSQEKIIVNFMDTRKDISHKYFALLHCPILIFSYIGGKVTNAIFPHNSNFKTFANISCYTVCWVHSERWQGTPWKGQPRPLRRFCIQAWPPLPPRFLETSTLPPPPWRNF